MTKRDFSERPAKSKSSGVDLTLSGLFRLHAYEMSWDSPSARLQ